MNDNTNASAPERTLADAEAEIAELKETITRVREAVRHGARMDVHPTRLANQTVQDSEQWWAKWHSDADTAWRQNLREALGKHA